MKLRSGVTSIYSLASASVMRRAIRDFQPDIVHFHGTCYQLTSSVANEVRRIGIPRIVTAHEYKFICANQNLWSDSQSVECKRCVGRSTLARSGQIVAERCIKGSLSASLAGSIEQVVSSVAWGAADPLIHCPSRFMYEMLKDDGIPSTRLFYLDLPWETITESLNFEGSRNNEPRRVVYIGRLADEKGVSDLIQAWPAVRNRHPDALLEIYGTGVAEQRLRDLVPAESDSISFGGGIEHAKVQQVLAGAAVTVHPSRWEENSPFSVRESLQSAVPVVVSRKGGMPEMVSSDTGQVFESGDAVDLASKINVELSLGRARTSSLAGAVRNRGLDKSSHLEQLRSHYESEIRTWAR